MKIKQTRHIGKKAFEIFLTLFVVTLLSFLLMRLSPIDPATAYVKRNCAVVTQEQIDAARIELGLDKPILVQYGAWVRNALSLEFGISLASGLPVIEEIGKAIPVTVSVVLVTGCIMSFGILLFACLNYFLRRKIAGYILTFLCIVGVSVPAFYLGSVFIDTFALKLGIISVSGNTGLMRYIPAALCLSVGGIAFYSQLLAKDIAHEMNEDYAFYARCRGLKESRILFFHALPHSAVGLIPSFMQMLGLCMAGAAVVERVFSLPGLGYLIIDSVIERDSPVIHVAVLFLACALVVFDLIAKALQTILQKDNTAMERNAS